MHRIPDTPADAAEAAFLGSAPATARDRRLALAAAALLLAALAATAPWADRPWRPVPAFAPIYDAAVIVLDAMTALLLFAQYRQVGRRSLLVLACGYLFTPLLMAAHALSFPGAYGPGSLLGGGQTTAWLWMGWHGLFPLFVAGYAVLARDEPPVATRGGSRRTAWLAAAATVALAAGAVVLATAGVRWLPELMLGDRYRSPATRAILSAGWAAHLLALAVLAARTRLRRVVDVWLAVTLVALLSDLALSAVLVDGRYDAGFYLGRAYGLLGAGLVLGVLLRETVSLSGAAARAAERVREREALLQALAANLPGGAAFVVGPGLRYRLAEGEALRDAGFVPASFVGKAVGEVLDPAVAEAYLPNYRRALAGEPFEAEHAAHGRLFVTRGTPLRDAEGRVTAALAVSFDVTVLRRAEAALRESEARLAAIFAQASVGLSEVDAGGRFLRVNDELCRLLGRPAGELLRLGVGDDTHPESVPPTLRAVAEVLRTGGPVTLDKVYRWPDGTPVWASSSLMRLRDGEGRPGNLLVVTADLTERRRAEAALRESEAKYRALFESMDQGFGIAEVLLDPTGRPADYRMLEINPQFERLTGQSRERFLGGRTVREVVPELEEEWFRFYGGVALTGQPARREIHAEAWGRWFEVSAYRVGDPAQRRVAILYGEITDRRRAEEALRELNEALERRVAGRTAALAQASRALSESEELFRVLVTTSALMVWTTDAAGRVVEDSPSWRAFTGQTREAWLGEGWARGGRTWSTRTTGRARSRTGSAPCGRRCRWTSSSASGTRPAPGGAGPTPAPSPCAGRAAWCAGGSG